MLAQLLASPLNLILVVLLPILLVLALVSLWLHRRARRELQERDAELAESTALQMEQDNTQYDQLLTANVDMSEELPDLHSEDETLSPAPLFDSRLDEEEFALSEVDLSDSDEEPASLGAVAQDDALLPAQERNDDYDEIDLSMTDDSSDLASDGLPDLSWLEEETSAPDDIVELNEGEARGDEDSDALLADLGVTEHTSEPELDLPELTAEMTPLAANELAWESTPVADDITASAVPDELPPESASVTAENTGADEALTGADSGLQDMSELETVSSLSADWSLDEHEIELDEPDTDLSLMGEAAPVSEPAVATPVESESPKPAQSFVGIDELLAQADAADSTLTSSDPQFDLTAGLDDFPDLTADGNDIDVDADDGGVGAKLDLARAYLEIDDKQSARELLEEALSQGTEEQQAEANKLLKRLS